MGDIRLKLKKIPVIFATAHRPRLGSRATAPRGNARAGSRSRFLASVTSSTVTTATRVCPDCGRSYRVNKDAKKAVSVEEYT